MLQSEQWRGLLSSLNVFHTHFGTPAYVYNAEILRNNVSLLKRLIGNELSVSYAVKANPRHFLLAELSNLVDHFDVSSAGELNRVLHAGVSADRVSFSGPAKRDFELSTALAAGTGDIVIESVEEARRIHQLCMQRDCIQRVLVRITPLKTPKHFGVSMAGSASQFGIDEERLHTDLKEILNLSRLDVAGFHIYSGSNCLCADSIIENFKLMVDCFSVAIQLADVKPCKLIFGAGFGLPYLQSDNALDSAAAASGINPLLQKFRYDQELSHCEFVLELGRWLVGPVGVLLTTVVASKSSRGREIRLCDAGFNNHLAAFGLMGSVIRRNWRIHNLSNLQAETARYHLVGPLCTAIDVLAQDIELPIVRTGDVLAIEYSGAYGYTASPLAFISHPLPYEVAIENGCLVDVSDSHTPDRDKIAPLSIGEPH